MGQLASGAGIVRAIEINVRPRLQAFQAPGPFRVRNALHDIFIGDAIAAILEDARGGKRVQCVLQLKPAGQAGL